MQSDCFAKWLANTVLDYVLARSVSGQGCQMPHFRTANMGCQTDVMVLRNISTAWVPQDTLRVRVTVGCLAVSSHNLQFLQAAALVHIARHQFKVSLMAYYYGMSPRIKGRKGLWVQERNSGRSDCVIKNDEVLYVLHVHTVCDGAGETARAQIATTSRRRDVDRAYIVRFTHLLLCLFPLSPFSISLSPSLA